jgi:hypothetical protein
MIVGEGGVAQAGSFDAPGRSLGCLNPWEKLKDRAAPEIERPAVPQPWWRARFFGGKGPKLTLFIRLPRGFPTDFLGSHVEENLI